VVLAETVEEFLGGFVVRVLRDNPNLECSLQDALTQPGRTLQIGFDLGFYCRPVRS